MIVTNKLCKNFEDFVAVKDVSLQINQGEVLALLGPNGAGKTTTIRMLTSLLKPTSGTAEVMGYDVTENSKLVRSYLGVLSENHGIYNRMPAYEYLDFFGKLYGIETIVRKERINKLLTEFDLAETADKRVGEFSKGMRQKLALVRALVHDPPVLLLDEPTSAMDPESARLVRNLIQELKSSNRTILICTHNLAEAEELADRITIIRKGSIIASGTNLELREKLLGPKTFEVKFTDDYQIDFSIFDDLLSVEDIKPDCFSYRTEDPMGVNPQVLEHLYQLGVQVVHLQEIPQSLEKVYLQAVMDRKVN